MPIAWKIISSGFVSLFSYHSTFRVWISKILFFCQNRRHSKTKKISTNPKPKFHFHACSALILTIWVGKQMSLPSTTFIFICPSAGSNRRKWPTNRPHHALHTRKRFPGTAACSLSLFMYLWQKSLKRYKMQKKTKIHFSPINLRKSKKNRFCSRLVVHFVASL